MHPRETLRLLAAARGRMIPHVVLEHREPAVAGRFYPGEASALEAAVARYMGVQARARPVTAVIAPHAGYVYSGPIAGQTYAQAVVPDRVIILCPNHTGLGVQRSLWSGDAWDLPGGAVPVDVELRDRVRRHAHLEPDTMAHLREHAIEVHVPFLRARNPNVQIVPIVLAGLDYDECREVGEGLARAIRETPGEVLIVASTDMSHYVSAEEAKHWDAMALDRVLAMDPEGLYRTVRQHRISMCGFIPTTVTLVACRALGASHVELVRYGNSGETSGDYDRVVGYAGLVVERPQ